MLFFSPLEQFKVIVLYPLHINDWDLSISNSTVYLLLVFIYLFVIFKRDSSEMRLIPDGIQRLSEIMYVFINNLVKQQAGIKGLTYFPVYLLLFYLIFFLNLVGLTPLGFTCTSQMCYTFTLGFSMFISVVITGVVVHKKDFIKLFIPATTGPIVPLLIVIEIFSYLIRPFSLSIRLFANMLAGHTLLHIVAGFGMSMIKIEFFLAVLMCLPLLAVCLLEVGIAFLQAYVFLVLICIYMKESFYGH